MATNKTNKNQEEVVKEVAEKPAAKKTVKKFAPDDMIECISVTGGELILVGDKTKLHYNWADFGDVSYVAFQDLQALQSRRSGFLTKPRFIIEDEELVEQWKSMLKPIYDKITTRDIEAFFALPINKFEAQLKVMPDGLKEAVKTKAVQMIQSGDLYDIRKVRAIDTTWKTDFVAMFMK